MKPSAVNWLDRRAYDCVGELLGVVVAVYDGPTEGSPAWLAIGRGPFGLRTAVVPLRGARLWGADVIVDFDRATVTAAPPGDVYVSLEPDDEARLVAYYAGHRCRQMHSVPPTTESTSS